MPSQQRPAVLLARTVRVKHTQGRPTRVHVRCTYAPLTLAQTPTSIRYKERCPAAYPPFGRRDRLIFGAHYCSLPQPSWRFKRTSHSLPSPSTSSGASDPEKHPPMIESVRTQTDTAPHTFRTSTTKAGLSNNIHYPKADENVCQ